MANKETYIIEQKLTTDNSSFVSGNKEAKTSTNELGGAVSGVKTKMKSLVSPTNIAAAAVGVLAYKTVQAVKNFAAYEKQLSSLNTLLKVSKTELNAYGDGLVDIAIKTGVAKETLADGAYQALSSGVDPAELLEFMETAAEGAAVGMTDVSTATDTLTSTLNGFKLESSDATDTMDKLITIQNNGKVVLGELSTVMGNVADISSSLGLDLDNIGAAISTITMNGTSASEAGTRLKAMFSELSKEGTTAYDTFQKITEKSFKDFISEGGNLGEALQEMQEYAEDNEKEMIDLWSSIEAGQGAMGITGSNAETFTKNLDAMKDSAGELEKAFDIASDNIETEWKKLTETLSGKWDNLVEDMRDPIIVTLKVIRKGLGGETDDDLREEATKSLTESESKIAELKKQAAELEAQIAENEKNPTWWSEKGWGGTDSLKIKLANIQEAIKTTTWEYEKASNDIAALDAKNAKTVKDDNPGNGQGGGGGGNNDGNDDDGNDPDKEKERLKKIAAYEAEHADEINQIDIGILEKKRAYYEDLNSQLEAGQISKEEYDKLAAAYDESSQAEQDEKYIEALEKLKAFYLKMGEVAKANEIEKQILEIEVETNINVGENYEEDTALKEFLASQLEAEKEFKSQMAELEANFQYEMLTLKSQGEITDSEFAQKEKDHQENLLTMTKQHDIDMLEEKRNFYALQKQDMETALEIEAEIIEKKKELKETEKKNDEEELTWRQLYEDFKQDITGMAETATKDAYRSAIENEENFAVALKSAMQEQLKEWLLVKGEEMAWKSLYEGAEALASLAHGDMAGFTAHTVSALEYAAQAAAFGVAASALSTSSSSSDSDDDDDYDYDDDDVSTTEDTASDSDDDSTTIYVNVDDSTMAKNMIAILEDELNDEYNVSIIGKKK
ncbi:phage tail tape measure protein [uncultured Ilyobacter sp.]|uniref:phage tail tape measure protein n=1 Tax=uncultured Ilyobacter sp. TaxID=544433 RepID=UPI002AA79513|nr:phage tail tape measure protein [uncultured Ilyobacter sp.]